MTVQEVMLKALSGERHWFRAADILGWSPRTLRRWRQRFEACANSVCGKADWLSSWRSKIPFKQLQKCAVGILEANYRNLGPGQFLGF